MNRHYTKEYYTWNIIKKVVVNSEQIRFDQKGRVEAEEEGALSQARTFICLEANPPDKGTIWNQCRDDTLTRLTLGSMRG